LSIFVEHPLVDGDLSVEDAEHMDTRCQTISLGFGAVHYP